MTKTQFLSALIGVSAVLDTAYEVLTENASLLVELGVNPKIVLIAKLAGLIVAIFSTSLAKRR